MHVYNGFISKKPKEKTKIVVAMSGGVDSSVAAAMLHNSGYDVIGITMQLYNFSGESKKKGACCAVSDVRDARSVADKFGFPHYVLNYESLFKEEVIEDFADSYLRGETPVPCIRCNQSVKFRDMVKVAKDLNADALATGHYVRRIEGKKKVELHSAIDQSKDQSYFMFATTQHQLEYLHFPLGDKLKDETRKIAKDFGLNTFNKPDSQDICFVTKGNYANFIEKLRPESIIPGEIFHIDGTKVGEHNGIINYTLGQRKGLGLSWSEPLYVVKIDAKNNKIFVGTEEHLSTKEFFLKDVNWLGDENLSSEPIQVDVKVRSTHSSVPAKISTLDNKHIKVSLFDTERAVTPGQACVFYMDKRVVGGGWILKEGL